MTSVGIIGSGIVGQTLAAGFIKKGYQVKLGTSAPEKLQEWAQEAGKGVEVSSVAECLKGVALVVLAVKGSAAEEVVTKYREDLSNLPVIDACNPIASKPPENGILSFTTDYNQSLLEKLQFIAPKAHFVKAFSCIGAYAMVDPSFVGGKPSMFICGNNAEAKKTVSQIVELFGHEVEDMGVAAAARAIEPLCILWCIPGFLKNDWMHAFKMIR